MIASTALASQYTCFNIRLTQLPLVPLRQRNEKSQIFPHVLARFELGVGRISPLLSSAALPIYLEPASGNFSEVYAPKIRLKGHDMS